MTSQLKAPKQLFAMVLFDMLCKVIMIFDSVNEKMYVLSIEDTVRNNGVSVLSGCP